MKTTGSSFRKSSVSVQDPKRKVKNPLGRLCLAALLTVWSGANIWSAIFRRHEIWTDDVNSRSVGLLFSILFVMVPLVLAIWLLWSVTAAPLADQKSGSTKESKKQASKKKSPRDVGSAAKSARAKNKRKPQQ